MAAPPAPPATPPAPPPPDTPPSASPAGNPTPPSATPRPIVPVGRPIRPPYSMGRHVRGVGVLLVLSILGLAVAYPAVVVEVGQLFDPSSANGSLTYNPNGTVNGSSLLPPGNATVNTSAHLVAPAGETLSYRPTVATTVTIATASRPGATEHRPAAYLSAERRLA